MKNSWSEILKVDLQKDHMLLLKMVQSQDM